MQKNRVISTRVLLICAAIGVASGIVGGVAGWVTPVVIATIPFVYGFVLGVHVIPGIIAQEVIRLPWVALLSHVMAGLVASAMAPQWAFRFLGTAIMFGAIQEGVAALTRYRVWQAWRFFISGIIIGVIVAVGVVFAARTSAIPLWLQIALGLLGPLVWTGLALLIGAGLRRAGVART